MAQESPGVRFQPAAPSSATPRSRLSRLASGNVEGPSHSARTPPPTTASTSLSARQRNDTASAQEEEHPAEGSHLHDAQKIQSPLRTRWLIGSTSGDRLVSMIQESSRQTPLPDYQFGDRPATEATAQTATPSDLDSMRLQTACLTFASTTSPISEVAAITPESPKEDGSLVDPIHPLAAKLSVSPQTIPETSTIDHSLYSPVISATSEYERDALSRNSSTRSMRMSRSARISTTSRRSSRRSTSANDTSVSPAYAFLASWGRADAEEPVAEPKPDDEGQAIGLNNEYIIGRTINRGGFGMVREVHSLERGGKRSVRAVKIIRKTVTGLSDTENEKVQQDVEHEVSIWRHLKHRNILSLHAVYETDFATFCVMDLNVGGTLFDLVKKARQIASSSGGRKGLPPHLAKSYAYQLACALRYLHEDLRVCHRDVKLENCLVDLTGPHADEQGGILRLCDFGLADFLHSESMDDTDVDRYTEEAPRPTDLPAPTASSVIGTLEYASPKGLSVHRKLFETAGDVWALGVIIYALCTGDLPFRHPLPSKTAELILRADWDEDALRHAAAGGGEVIDLVKGCLEKDMDMRFTVGDALRSSWFEGCREGMEEGSARAGWA